MNPRDKVKIDRRGHIYFGYRAAQALGITGWEWLKITPYGEHTLMRICMTSVTSEAGSHVVKLNKVRGSKVPLAGSCLKFADELAARFGEFESLNLRYVICPEDVHGDGDSVLISVDNPPNKFVPANSDIRTIPEQEEEIEAREAYFAGFGKSLGTISKPAGSPATGKSTVAPRTRPLPENIPDWLRTPMSKGLHVEVAAIGREKHGWAIGAFKNAVSGNTLIAVYFDNVLPCAMCFPTELSPARSRLKPAVECYKVAGKLGIGLSPLQIKTINSGGVPPTGHGLPNEMFE